MPTDAGGIALLVGSGFILGVTVALIIVMAALGAPQSIAGTRPPRVWKPSPTAPGTKGPPPRKED